MRHPFRSVVRLSVVVDILKTPMRLGGAGLKVDKMKLDGKILTLFPKHCKGELHQPVDFRVDTWGRHCTREVYIFVHLVYRSCEVLSTIRRASMTKKNGRAATTSSAFLSGKNTRRWSIHG